MPVEAGILRYRVDIYRDEPTANTDGQMVETEKFITSRWAGLRQTTARDSFSADQLIGLGTWIVTLRRDAVTDKIGHGYWVKTQDGKKLNVTGVVRADIDYLELTAEERSDAY